MKYLTGYVSEDWDCASEYRGESVLLQQVRFGRCSAVFACVCGGGTVGSYVTGSLKGWFAGRGRELFGARADTRSVGKELEREWRRLFGEVKEYRRLRPAAKEEGEDADGEIPCAAVLAADQNFWMLCRGGGSLYLVNRRFQRLHLREIGQNVPSSEEAAEGRIQRSVGVLLGNRDFLASVPQEVLGQCLAVQDISREGQIDRRLAEIAQESRRQGYGGTCGAVYIKTV